MSQHTKDIETSIITSAINNMRKTYETDNQPSIDEICNLETLPHRFFFYGTIRDDAVGTKFAATWTKCFAVGCKGYTAKIYGFKIYQHLYESYPFAIQTNWKQDFVIGRLMEFDDKVFSSKLTEASYISSYFPNDPRDSVYTPIIVDAYLEEDDEYDKNMKYGKIFKAVTFYRKSETICSYYLKQCCPVPFNDWLQSDYFFDENELQSRHFCNISFYNSAYDAKVQEWFARNAENKDDDIDINSVELWLSNEVNLRQYIDNFLSNGFDDINVIPEIMTENELIEIGVDKKGHRKKIMLFIDKLKKSSGEIGVSDIVKIKKQYPQKFKSLLAKMENNKTITNSSSTTETTEDVESTKYTHLGTEEQDMKLLSVNLDDKNVSVKMSDLV